MNLPILVFDAGLELFHVSKLNNEAARTEWLHEMSEFDPKYRDQMRADFLNDTGMTYEQYLDKMFLNTPINEVNVTLLDHPKYFGLTEEFPYYYGANDVTTGASKYVTNRPIVLIDIAYTDARNRLIGIENCTSIDGWITFDDVSDRWREIYIFRPFEVMAPGQQYHLSSIPKDNFNGDKGYELYSYSRLPYFENIFMYLPEWENKELNMLRSHLLSYYQGVVNPGTCEVYRESEESDPQAYNMASTLHPHKGRF